MTLPLSTDLLRGEHLVGGDPQDAGFSRRARAGDGPGAKPLPDAAPTGLAVMAIRRTYVAD